jgi:RNA polymerase sigma-70 factor, ECF subfamily
MGDEYTVAGSVRQVSPPMNRDDEAVNRLFASYMGQLRSIALRVLRSPEDAEDAVQDAVLSAWQQLNTFEGRSEFSTWLYRIVINAALMHLRRRHTHPLLSIDEQVSPAAGSVLADSIVDPRPGPEEVCAQTELRQIVAARLEELPDAYRSVLRLCVFQGMRAKEAAQALGVSQSTVKSRLHRARLKFFGHKTKFARSAPPDARATLTWVGRKGAATATR